MSLAATVALTAFLSGGTAATPPSAEAMSGLPSSLKSPTDTVVPPPPES